MITPFISCCPRILWIAPFRSTKESLAKKVERASELIELCRKKLRKAESDVEKLFE